MIEVFLNEYQNPVLSNENVYRISGCTVRADRHIEILKAHYVGKIQEPLLISTENFQVEKTNFTEIYHGSAWVSGETRVIHCRLFPSFYLLEISGIGDFQIASTGSLIRLIERDTQAEDHLVEEALLGPAMSLAFALQGMWCLHASAAYFRNQLVVFLGESGKGKSTLAGYLGNESHSDWQLAADDILAVKGSEQLINALIQYPQLKYSAEAQPWLKLPESLPVSSIFVLEDLGKNGGDMAIQRLKTDMGTLALARYTVASVLFDPGLLASHLAFCSQASRFVPISQLTYPRKRDYLPAIRAALESNLSSDFL